MMDDSKPKIAPHKPKFLKQVFYYFIVVILQIRLKPASVYAMTRSSANTEKEANVVVGGGSMRSKNTQDYS